MSTKTEENALIVTGKAPLKFKLSDLVQKNPHQKIGKDYYL
ncbi:hypothetical protein [Chryseobacterium chendengshani]|nr:hypothetical protein [Chryseobacterium sp. LJ668]